jgi:hypothetical protein
MKTTTSVRAVLWLSTVQTVRTNTSKKDVAFGQSAEEN